ncbi:hypothetical protein PR048_007917 [Dryococelus australis]|uniref:Uncharacterized protein n=1 Tax=Dryococelus australis TaxID=614101 RepID=A0ABQ9HVZ0_9NEOP|nr:hypothetical protein PR048_007917 [Dryococelus australis]
MKPPLTRGWREFKGVGGGTSDKKTCRESGAKGAAVSERLACSPPAKANRDQCPAGSHDFRKWESCRTMPLVGGFSQGSHVSPPPPSFPRHSILTTITLIGSQDFADRLGDLSRPASASLTGQPSPLRWRGVGWLGGVGREWWRTGCWSFAMQPAECCAKHVVANVGNRRKKGRGKRKFSGECSGNVAQELGDAFRARVKGLGRDALLPDAQRLDPHASPARLPAGMQGRGRQDIPEKTRRAALSGTIPTCDNPGAAPPGIEPGSPWLEATGKGDFPTNHVLNTKYIMLYTSIHGTVSFIPMKHWPDEDEEKGGEGEDSPSLMSFPTLAGSRFDMLV